MHSGRKIPARFFSMPAQSDVRLKPYTDIQVHRPFYKSLVRGDIELYRLPCCVS